MAGFKEQIEADLDVFFNTDEFAEEHEIDGVTMPVIIDNDMLKEQQRKMMDPSGFFLVDLVFHVKKSCFLRRPEAGNIMMFDKKPRRIADVQEDTGVYTITLAANLS